MKRNSVIFVWDNHYNLFKVNLYINKTVLLFKAFTFNKSLQSWLKIKGNVLQIRVFRSEQSLEILLDNYHPVKWVEETIKCKSISDTHRTMKLVSFKTLENKEERTHILSNCLLCKKKLKQGAHKKKLGWKLHMDFISYLSIYSSFLNSKKETNG